MCVRSVDGLSPYYVGGEYLCVDDVPLRDGLTHLVVRRIGEALLQQSSFGRGSNLSLGVLRLVITTAMITTVADNKTQHSKREVTAATEARLLQERLTNPPDNKMSQAIANGNCDPVIGRKERRETR